MGAEQGQFKFKDGEQDAIKALVQDTYFVIKRTAFWYFVGGAVMFVVAATGLSWGTAYGTVKGMLSDESVRLVTAEVEAIRSKAVASGEEIEAILQTAKASDRSVSVIEAGSSGSPAVFTVSQPSLILVQATIAVERKGLDFRPIIATVTVDGRPCTQVDVSRGLQIANCYAFAAPGRHKIEASAAMSNGAAGKVSIGIDRAVLRLGACTNGKSGLECPQFAAVQP